jgi:ATP-dependent exoDNAse (exonuclease V) alpha subunit
MKQEIALKILKSGQNTFITGAAGTGKSYLIQQYVNYLETIKIYPAIVAPTGIAASHLGGNTIHSFFGISIDKEVDDEFLHNLKGKKHIAKRMNSLKVLIVDEVSMISPKLFEEMDKILKFFKDPFEPFGGVQVILSGDFFQLPPILDEESDKIFAWQSPVWKDLDFRTCYLQKQFRQNEESLIKVLNEIREGKVSESSIAILNSRMNIELHNSFKPTRLHTHNINVDKINMEQLDKLKAKKKVFHAEVDGEYILIEKIFKTSLVLKELSLKVGATVIFIKNNIEKGYVNGTTGVIVSFGEKGFPVVQTSSGMLIIASSENWSISDHSGATLAKVSQIPLRLAWALTIHKSQGMTLDSAEIDLSKTFEVGQGYVALSRVKSIEGLKLLGFNKKALEVNQLILKIDNRIKEASKRAEAEINLK